MAQDLSLVVEVLEEAAVAGLSPDSLAGLSAGFVSAGLLSPSWEKRDCPEGERWSVA